MAYITLFAYIIDEDMEKTDEIKKFYNNFLESRMLKYRIRGNRRIELATERVLEFVQPDSHILDIGCGIGIATEQMARAAPHGHVWGCDISDRNIWYARQTVQEPNLSFFVADTLDQEYLFSKVKSDIDVISLVDVIEHIPSEEHGELFEFFSSISSGDTVIVLTYPSPQYQRYLAEENPEKLQVIDQIIKLDTIRQSARSGGFSLKHFSLEDVWLKNQYVHCVFQNENSLEKNKKDSSSTIEWMCRQVDKAWRRFFIRPYRRYKYINRVFDQDMS